MFSAERIRKFQVMPHTRCGPSTLCHHTGHTWWCVVIFRHIQYTSMVQCHIAQAVLHKFESFSLRVQQGLNLLMRIQDLCS